jgi:hypothetical protein
MLTNTTNQFNIYCTEGNGISDYFISPTPRLQNIVNGSNSSIPFKKLASDQAQIYPYSEAPFMPREKEIAVNNAGIFHSNRVESYLPNTPLLAYERQDSFKPDHSLTLVNAPLMPNGNNSNTGNKYQKRTDQRITKIIAFSSSIKKKRKTKKNKIIISMNDMLRIFPLPQTIAAKKLGVSISTLKRRFYELDMIRWPANYCLHEFNFARMNPAAISSKYYATGSASDLIRSSIITRQNACFYSLYKESTVEEKMSLGTLLNLFDTANEKYIDPMTEVILKKAFLENTDQSEEKRNNSCDTSGDEEKEVNSQICI